MEELSQLRQQRARRPWTDEDQRQAEALRAEGAGYRAIGRALGRHNSLVRYRLDRVAAEAQRACQQKRYELNPEKGREYSRQYRLENAEIVRERDRDRGHRYRQDAREQEIERHRRYRERNKDKIREAARRYRAANAQKLQERQRRWQELNPEKKREYSRRWYKRNTEQACECARRNNSARRAAHRRALVPLTSDQKRHRYALFENRCAYCGSVDRLTVDHVVPLSAGGLDEITNIVPACFGCNRSKWANLVEGWYRRQPFFSEARWQKIQHHCPGVAAGQLPLAFAAQK